jgi:UDP:flavonoid glycosyltransferase YjiC (YdhE family)
MRESGKKNILIVNLPFSGHTNPTLGLAKTLVSMGHDVCFINAPDWKEKIEKAGATFIPYDDYPDTLSSLQKKFKSWYAAYRTAERIGTGGDFDCLIYDALFLPGKALADRLGIPAFRLFSTFAQNERVLKDFGETGGLYVTALFRYKVLRKLVSKQMQKVYGLRYGDIVQEIVHNAADNIRFSRHHIQYFRRILSEMHRGFPQLKILQHASLFITHDGMNSVNEALYCGTPMLL